MNSNFNYYDVMSAMFIIMAVTTGSPQVLHCLIHHLKLLLFQNRYLQLPALEKFLLLFESALVLCYYHHCFPSIMSHCKQCLCHLDLCLSPYIPTSGSVQKKPSAGQCLQLENFASVSPTSVLDSSPSVSTIEICSLKHSWWRHYHIVSKLLGYIGCKLFSSWIVSTVSGCELMITSVSII